MITGLKIEFSEDSLLVVVMLALEAQFRATALCLNKVEYHLHRQTEIALGEIYLKISKRKTEFERMGDFINTILYGCETVQGGGTEYEDPAEGIFQNAGSVGTGEGESCRKVS